MRSDECRYVAESSVASTLLVLSFECLIAKLVWSWNGKQFAQYSPQDGFALLVWHLARRWQHPATVWPPLSSIVSMGLLMDMLCPMMDRDVSWLRLLATQCRSMGWLEARSSLLLSTFKHAEPVNCCIPGSAHESTADQQNHSWHILAVNAKHNLTNSYLGKWTRRCQPSPKTQVDKYTQTF